MALPGLTSCPLKEILSDELSDGPSGQTSVQSSKYQRESIENIYSNVYTRSYVMLYVCKHQQSIMGSLWFAINVLTRKSRKSRIVECKPKAFWLRAEIPSVSFAVLHLSFVFFVSGFDQFQSLSKVCVSLAAQLCYRPIGVGVGKNYHNTNNSFALHLHKIKGTFTHTRQELPFSSQIADHSLWEGPTS